MTDPDLEDLTASLATLTHAAETTFRAQPRATRTALTKQTRTIFDQYARHGSAARLKHNLRSFLDAGDDGLSFTTKGITPTPTSNLAAAAETRTLDGPSAALIPLLPFHLDRTFSLHPTTHLPPDLLESVDRIFGLYALEARALLAAFCEKYGVEAVFRAGIRELVMSRSDALFQNIRHSDLGLTPETSEFLFSVYERSPRLNVAETRMLVRATRVEEDTIEFFCEFFLVPFSFSACVYFLVFFGPDVYMRYANADEPLLLQCYPQPGNSAR